MTVEPPGMPVLKPAASCGLYANLQLVASLLVWVFLSGRTVFVSATAALQEARLGQGEIADERHRLR